MVAAVVTVALAGGITHRLTERSFAAFVTVVMIIGYHSFVRQPGLGIFPKFFTLAFGLAGLWMSLDDRHVLASAFATVAAGFWQWGIVFMLLVYGRAYRREQLGRWRPMALASGGVTAAAVLPIVLSGGGLSMLVQVVIDPFRLGDHGQSLADRITKFVQYTEFLWPLMLVGGAGALDAAIRNRRYAWIAAGIAVPVMQLLFIDFDAAADIYLLLVFAALGLGVAVGTLSLNRRQRVLVGCLVLCCVGGQLATQAHTLDTPRVSPVDASAKGIRGAFLDQRIPPKTCAISMGDVIERVYADRPDPRFCGPQIPPLTSSPP